MHIPTTIYLMRHGESVWNVEKRIQGQGKGNSPLTELGKKQALEVSHELKSVTFDHIFSSDSVRAVETANIIAADRHMTIETSPQLRERSFGKYEGTDGDTFFNMYKDWDKLTKTEKFTYKIDENEESHEEGYNRLHTFLVNVAEKYPGKTLLCVSHGGLIRALLIKQGLGDFESVGGLTNCGYTVISMERDTMKILETKGLKTWLQTRN